MASKKRVKISDQTVGQLLFKTDNKCCVCSERGDHIHHLDGNPSNNILDNLAFLCFNDHDSASLKGTLRKKLTKEAIVNYRRHHYQVIENKRKKELGTLDRPISHLTNEKLLTVTKNALIILEIENIKSKYYSAEWDTRAEIINELGKYVDHSNNRLSYDILGFLSYAANQTRSGMPENVASSIFLQVLNYSPSLHDKRERKESIELAKQCIHIGGDIAYDSFIHLRKIKIAMFGLTVIKSIYIEAKRNKILELISEVENSYKELKSTLQRPERKDLGDAQETLKTFYDDLNDSNLKFPILSEHLMKRLEKERKEKS